MTMVKSPQAFGLAEELEMMDSGLMQRKKLVLENVGSRCRSF